MVIFVPYKKLHLITLEIREFVIKKNVFRLPFLRFPLKFLKTATRDTTLENFL